MTPKPLPSDETTCARPPRETPSVTAPLAPALESSVVYRVGSLDEVDAIYAGDQPGFLYARDAHPNLRQLCEKVSALEGAEAAWAGASGMAVEAMLVLSVVATGDDVAVAEGVYGKTARLVDELARFGVTRSRFDPTRPETLRTALRPNTKVVLVETLSNPLLRVADIAGLAEVAHERNCLLCVDHTFAPLLCQPLALGADLVCHSATKYLGGHSDLTLGVIAGGATLIERIGQSSSTFGCTANPYECWMCLRGLATLAVRVERAAQNALVLAERLERLPRVHRVHYPGLPSHPDHEQACKMLSGGFGAMMTLDLKTRAEADRLIRALGDRIPFAPSLGDVATTLSHPATTSHRGLTSNELARQGIHPGLVRVSVGIENVEDLWREFEAAIQGGS